MGLAECTCGARKGQQTRPKSGAEQRELDALEQLQEAVDALKAIYTSTREDAKGQQHTIRGYLDARGVFNDDVGGSRRLVALAAAYALARVGVAQ